MDPIGVSANGFFSIETHDSQRRSSDPVSWYLATIGRIPLLTPAEEIELGNQVQAMMLLTEDGSRTFDDAELDGKQRRFFGSVAAPRSE